MKVISLLLFVIACSSLRKDVPDQYQSVFLSKYEDYRICYLASKSFQERNSDGRVRIVVGVTIQKDGTVSEERIIKSEVVDQSLFQCILSHVHDLRFQPQKSVIDLSQPINFFPKAVH